MTNELTQAIADLRKVVETNPNRDRFPIGTVIRWTASRRYTYAVIKTEVGWFSTARPGNPYVSGQMDYEELLEILGRSETTDIAIASAWSGLDGSSVPDPGLPTGALFREGRGLVSRSRAGLYSGSDPSADAGDHRTFADANPGVTFDDEPRNADGF